MSRQSFLAGIGSKGMRLNRRAELFRRDRECALFNALNQEVSYFDARLWTVLKMFKSSLKKDDVELLHTRHVKGLSGQTKRKAGREFWRQLSDLKKKKLLVRSDFREEGEIERFQKELLKRVGMSRQTLLIIPSFDCNYRCKYCFYFEGATPPKARLSWEKAKLGIDWFFNQLDIKQGLEKRIQFYGGEPLLNYDLVAKILNYVSHKNALKRWRKFSFNLSVITNGSLIDEKWIELFKEHGVHVSISLDGKKEINDRMRVDSSGKGASDRTFKGIRLLNAHGIEPNIAITLNQYNLGKLAEQVRWIDRNFKIGSIGFSHFIPIEGKSVKGITKDRLVKDCSRAFDKLFKWDLFEVEMMKRWKHFIDKTPPPFSCPGHFSQAVLLPDGRIGPCQMYALTGKQFEVLKSPKQRLVSGLWKRWRSSSHFFEDRCIYECNLFMLCGGACPYVAELKTDEFVPYDDDRCAFYRMLLEKYIWYKFDRI